MVSQWDPRDYGRCTAEFRVAVINAVHDRPDTPQAQVARDFGITRSTLNGQASCRREGCCAGREDCQATARPSERVSCHRRPSGPAGHLVRRRLRWWPRGSG